MSLMDKFSSEELLDSGDSWYCKACKSHTRVRRSHTSHTRHRPIYSPHTRALVHRLPHAHPHCTSSTTDACVQARKKLEVWSAPKVLVVHIKRFAYSAERRGKIRTRVDFPVEVSIAHANRHVTPPPSPALPSPRSVRHVAAVTRVLAMLS